MQELWIPWEKTQNVERYSFHKFGYEMGAEYLEPVITLNPIENKREQLKIVFDGFVGGYRLTTDKNNIQTRISHSGYDLTIFKNNFLFVIENSEYLAWLAEQCYHSWPSVKSTHYMILTDNAIIDVYSWSDPIVRKN